MVAQTNFHTGEQVKYNGKPAFVVSNNCAFGTITIVVDGKLITVNKNDLFGMNSKPDSTYSDIMNSRNERIEKKEKDMESYKEMYSSSGKMLEKIQKKIRKFLAEWGVTDESQINDASKKKEYDKLAHEQHLAMCDRNSASYFIKTTADDLIGEYCHKGVWEQMGVAFGLV